MKILIMVSDLHSAGGVIRSVSNLANNLIKNKDIEIEVVSVFKTESESMFYKLEDGIKKSYMEIDLNSKMNKVKKQILFLNSIEKKIKSDNYNVVMSTNAHFNIYLAILKKKFKKMNFIGAEHGGYNHISKGWRILTKICYKKLDSVVLLTSKEIAIYKKFCRKIYVIPNINTFSPKEYIKQEKKNILLVGRIDDNKNQIDIINAFDKLKNKYSDWKIYIVGSGEICDLEKLKNKISELRLEDFVYIKEFTEDVEAYYQNADIFVLTSKKEGLPMVLIEAMSYKIPCISYDIKTGPSDVIIDGKNGYLINFDNDRIENLAEKLSYLMENNLMRESMGIYAQQSIKKFNCENIISLWEKCFRGQ